MSPEQARGRPVDKRADIWAFGCVLFEMLTGRRTFDAEDVTATLGAVIHKEPPWDTLPRETPAAVRTVLYRCLQKDPKQRLRDIGDAHRVVRNGGQCAGAACCRGHRILAIEARVDRRVARRGGAGDRRGWTRHRASRRDADGRPVAGAVRDTAA
jgi:hypothetical protein